MTDISDAIKPHIFIVDDEPANIRMLSAGLRDDYDISVAKGGHEALEAIENSKKPVDLILLDILMPDLSGYNVCSTLKRKEETRGIPVIFVTAKTSNESEEKGLELGAVDYITKPFRLPIVQARVKTHVTLKQQHDFLQKLVKEKTIQMEQVENEYQRLFNNTLRPK